MREWLRTVLVVGAMAVIGYAISEVQSDRPLVRVAELEKQVNGLRAEVRDARKARPQAEFVRANGVSEADVTRSETEPPDPSEDENEGTAEEEEQGAEEAAASAVEQDAYVRFEFEQSSPGDDWSIDSETILNEKFEEHLGSAHLKALECRKDLCRAEVEHSDQEGYDLFMNKLLGNSHDLWKGKIDMYRIGTEDGGTRQSFYFARPGTEIPQLN